MKWTVAELLRWTESYFERIELLSPRLDAEILLAKALSCSRIQLYTDFSMLVEPEERATFRAFVERRARREPVAYITGRREFYALAFDVSPSVLVPRPETEHLVESALKALAGPSDRLRRVLDLGTGSGCIAIAIAVNAPSVEVDAVDISLDALTIARQNAETHKASSRIRLLQGDLFDALPAGAGPYDAIVSNPPYISSAEYDRLMGDVRLHEPRQALLDTKSPGADGLGFYRILARESASRLAEGGFLAVEVGAGQASGVREILGAEGWACERTIRDYGGIERVVLVRRSGGGAPGAPIAS